MKRDSDQRKLKQGCHKPDEDEKHTNQAEPSQNTAIHGRTSASEKPKKPNKGIKTRKELKPSR